MSGIDLIDAKGEFDDIDVVEDDAVEDINGEEKNTKRRTTKQQLKVRRAIEDHLDHKRFRHEVDYLYEDDF